MKANDKYPILGANADAFNCASCPSCRGDLCAHTGNLVPIPVLKQCPRTRQVAPVKTQRRERRKVSKPDRSLEQPRRAPWDDSPDAA